jgi:hypothetical protein
MDEAHKQEGATSEKRHGRDTRAKVPHPISPKKPDKV